MQPDRAGEYPIDESVYGVRDLAGSVDELTTGKPVYFSGNVSRRGGFWNSIDEYNFRIANRLTHTPYTSRTRASPPLDPGRMSKHPDS